MTEDSDGQQITVAELLKRMGAEQQEVAPTGRRRRRADEGGVSVSELTGEIPRITDDTVLSGRAARRHAREAEAAEGGSSPSADEPRAKGDQTGAGAGTAQSGATGGTTTPTPQPSPPKSGQAPASPSQARPSPTAQQSSAAQPSASQTARIPAQQPGAQQQAPAQQPPTQQPPTQQPPTPGAGAPVSADEAPEGQPQKKRRGLFGRKRKEKDSAAAARPSGAWTPDARDDRGPSGVGVGGDAAAGGAAAGAAGLAGTTATGPDAGSQAGPGQPTAAQTQAQAQRQRQTQAQRQKQAPTRAEDSTAGDPAAVNTAGRADSAPDRQQAWGVPTGSGSTAHSAPGAPAGGVAAGTAAEDKATDKNSDAAPATTAPAPGVKDAGAATGSAAAEGTEKDGREGSFGRAAAAAAGGAGVAGMTAAAVSGDRDSAPATTDRYRDADPDSEPDTARADHADTERSPASQWMILVAQVLASAVAGAALFIGFQLLWTDLPWVAFALAIIVIVGLVAMVRVLRRSNDTVSIALAVIVGVGVTCGPLLLRLVT